MRDLELLRRLKNGRTIVLSVLAGAALLWVTGC